MVQEYFLVSGVVPPLDSQLAHGISSVTITVALGVPAHAGAANIADGTHNNQRRKKDKRFFIINFDGFWSGNILISDNDEEIELNRTLDEHG